MIVASMDGNPGMRPAYPQLTENWVVACPRKRYCTPASLEAARLGEGGECRSGASCTPPISQVQALKTALLMRFRRTRGMYQRIMGGYRIRMRRSRWVAVEALQIWEEDWLVHHHRSRERWGVRVRCSPGLVEVAVHLSKQNQHITHLHDERVKT